jgi:hypothetical protein
MIAKGILQSYACSPIKGVALCNICKGTNLKKSMTYLVRALSSFVLLTSSISSQAALVSWGFSGTFDETLSGDALTALAFNGAFNYDTDALLIGSSTGVVGSSDFGSGFQHQYDPSAMSFSVNVEGRPTETFSFSDPTSFNILWLRDNTEDLSASDPFSPADGFSAILSSATYYVSIIFRGSDLNLINGNSLDDLDLATFSAVEINEFSFGFIDPNGGIQQSIGRIDFTTVNEPSVFMVKIMGFGLMVYRRVRTSFI